jgi:hypothetical protein
VVTGISLKVIVTVLQASVAVMVPVASPHCTTASGGQKVIVGMVTSLTQVYVMLQGVEVLLALSIAVRVKVCARSQPLVWMVPATQLVVGLESQLSETVTNAAALAQVGSVGLQPNEMGEVGQL